MSDHVGLNLAVGTVDKNWLSGRPCTKGLGAEQCE
jgi:hypothetical protein